MTGEAGTTVPVTATTVLATATTVPVTGTTVPAAEIVTVLAAEIEHDLVIATTAEGAATSVLVTVTAATVLRHLHLSRPPPAPLPKVVSRGVERPCPSRMPSMTCARTELRLAFRAPIEEARREKGLGSGSLPLLLGNKGR